MRVSTAMLVLALTAAVAVAQKDEPREKDSPTVPEGKLTLTLDPGVHTSSVRRVFFNPSDGNQLISLADDGAIRLWDVAEGRTTNVIYPPGVLLAPHAAGVSKDGKRLAVYTRYSEKGKEIYAAHVLSLPQGRLE